MKLNISKYSLNLGINLISYVVISFNLNVIYVKFKKIKVLKIGPRSNY